MVRMEKGLYLINYDQKDFLNEKTSQIYSKCIDAVFTKDGNRVIVIINFKIVDKKELVILSLDTEKRVVIKCKSNRTFMKINLSNTQKFLQTLQKVTVQEYYITVYDQNSAKEVFELPIKNQDRTRWPNIHFSDNDKLAFIVDGLGITSYQSDEGFKEWKRFPVKNCEELSISPGYQGTFRIAAIVPEVCC